MQSLSVSAPAVKSGVPDNLTVRGLIDQHLELTNGECCVRRDEERRRVLELFAKAHDSMPAADCRAIHLARFLKSHGSLWKSNWTLKSVAAIVLRAFNWATKMGLLQANPVRGLSVPRGEPQRPMGDAEFKKLYRAADRRFKGVLTFLRLTGSRPGELSMMTWGDVDFDKGRVTLKHHKTSAKTGKPRVIYLPPDAVKLLLGLRKDRKPRLASLVFTNRSGRAWTRCSLSLRMQRLRRRAGVKPDAKLYSLRHAFAVRCIKNNVNLKLTSLLMGHTNLQTTQHYLEHVAAEVGTLQAAAAQAVAVP